MTFRRVGESAFLVESGDVCPHDLVAALDAAPCRSRVRELVPAAETVLVVARHPADVTMLRGAVGSLLARGIDTERARDAKVVRIDVTYDGIDLEHVADASGLTIEEVVAAHTGAEHVVEFFGFAPGFAYLGGLPGTLRLSRLDDPRVRIDPGTVAIAGGHTVIYPGGTPGGWHQIGHTDAVLWDPTNEPPNLLEIGDRVHFRPALAAGEPA